MIHVFKMFHYSEFCITEIILCKWSTGLKGKLGINQCYPNLGLGELEYAGFPSTHYIHGFYLNCWWLGWVFCCSNKSLKGWLVKETSIQNSSGWGSIGMINHSDLEHPVEMQDSKSWVNFAIKLNNIWLITPVRIEKLNRTAALVSLRI